MRAAFYTLGCKINQAETFELSNKFVESGYEVVDFNDGADVVVINTCAVTQLVESESRKMIRRAKRNNPESIICAIGCYIQYSPEDFVDFPEIDFIVGNQDKLKLPEMIKNKYHKSIEPIEQIEFEAASSADPDERTRAVVKIQDGCDYFCSYCAVAIARGRSRSMDFNSVIPFIQKTIDRGFKEIILSGVNLGTYKGANGETFFDVIKLIENSDLNARFRISSIEPNLLSKDMLDFILNSKKFCPHFHLPLQSGSNAILAKMKRRYTADQFEELVNYIRSKSEDCCIGADVICGFPGESDELFNESLELIERSPISYLHPFTYSIRQKTLAAQDKAQIQKNIKKERTNILRELSEKKKREFYASQLNKNKTVLLEKIDDSGVIRGWTENYVRVQILNDNLKENEFYTVNLLRFDADLACLVAEQ